MSDNEILLKRAERFSTFRRVFLVINGLAYLVWIGTKGLQYVPQAGKPDMFAALSNMAFPVWLVSLLAVCWQMVSLKKHRDIAGLVDDERTAGLKSHIFQIGYWVLLLTVAGLYTLSLFRDIDARLVLPFLLGLGVAVPSLASGLLNRN